MKLSSDVFGFLDKKGRIMKKSTRFILFALLVATFASFMTVGALAEIGGDIQDANIACGNEALDKLRDLRTKHYAEKYAGDPYKAEYNTCDKIDDYESYINGMVMDTVQDRTKEIELAYNKGVAAGILSWIYYSHHEVAGVDSIAQIYEEKLAVIGGKSDPAVDMSFFVSSAEGNAPPVEKCYAELLNGIYSYKLDELLLEGDSENVRTIIEYAKNTIGDECGYIAVDSNGSLGEDAANYKSYYDRKKALVERQRNRDAVNAEMKEVFSKLYENEDFESSRHLSSFHNALKSRQTVTDMNTLLADTVVNLAEGLKEDNKTFRNGYLDRLISAVRTEEGRANGVFPAKIADMSEIFESYELGIYIADKKDELYAYGENKISEENHTAYRAGKIREIVASYTEYEGLFDKSLSKDEIDRQFERSKTRCDWYGILFETEDGILKYLEGESEPLQNARNYHEIVDTVIKVGNHDGKDLAEDTEKITAYVTDAEVIRFNTDHKDIIEKAEVTSADRSAIALAISDSDKLSDGAETVLSDTLTALGEKYKSATKDEINSYRKNDGAKSEREDVAKRLRELAEKLSAKDVDGKFNLSALKDEADKLVEKAELLNDVMNTYADEYLAGRGRVFENHAAGAVNDAADRIIAASDGSEESMKNSAVAELLQLTALERIYGEAGGHEAVTGVPELLEKAKNDIKVLTDKSAINDYADGRIVEIRELVRRNEVTKAKAEIGKLSETIKAEIEGYKYITDGEKAQYLSELSAKKTAADSAVMSAPDAQKVVEALNGAKAELKMIKNRAAEKEKNTCLEAVKGDIDAVKVYKDNYSAENYSAILGIIDEYKEKLSLGGSVLDYETVRREAIAKIGEIEDLLETAKRLGRERLAAEYNGLMKNQSRYSEENLTRLSEIYNHSMSELELFTNVSESSSVYAFTDERIDLMRGVYLDELYTSDGLFTDSAEPELPEPYDPEIDGYSGYVSSQGGITPDMSLSISYIDTDGIESVLKNAAKKKLIRYGNGSALDKALLRTLQKGKILAGFNIELGGETVHGKEYSVSLLIPSNIDISDVIGVIFVNGDGSVEYYEILAGERKIDFSTSHFSDYYIVGRGDVNLVPWIICLCIIVACELAVIAILILRRKKRTEGGALYSAVLPIALATVYKPRGGVAALVALGVTAVALAGLIAYLLYLEIKAARTKAAQTEELPVFVTPEAMPAEEAPLPQISEKNGERGLQLVDSVTVAEADILMSDEEAKEICEEIKNLEYEDTEVYRGAKKAEVNIDTISDFFKDGDTVTLNTLKEMKLVGANVGHVKVLARGRLDKSLTVVAQDFSSAAMKMILLTGGRAIITHPSKERMPIRRKH